MNEINIPEIPETERSPIVIELLNSVSQLWLVAWNTAVLADKELLKSDVRRRNWMFLKDHDPTKSGDPAQRWSSWTTFVTQARAVTAHM